MDARLANIWDRWFAAFAGVVLLFTVFLFMSRLGERSLWSEEVRWVQIPREMQQSRDYFHPTINGHSYYDKPLGSYWLVLAATGNDEVTEHSARLPCAIAGLISVALVMLIARQVNGGRTGIFAGAALATSFSIVFFSRNASADLENVAGILAALWLYLSWEGKPAGWRTIVLWLLMAITSLTKGLLGFAIPLLVIAAYCSFGPANWRVILGRQRWLLNRWTLLAVPLAVALYLAPFYISFARTGSNDGLAMVFRENLRRFVDPVNHRGPVWLYAAAIFPLLAPWSALLPAALCHVYVRWRSDDSRQRFPLIYFWSTFIFFTLSASRRSYYLLPVLPAAAMLIARMLAEPIESQRRTVRWLTQAGVIAVAVVLMIVSVAIAWPATMRPSPYDHWPAVPNAFAFACVFFGAAVLNLLVAFRFRPLGIAGAMFVAASVCMTFVFGNILPGFEEYRTRKPFAEAVRQNLKDDLHSLALYRHREIVYYLASTDSLTEFDSIEALTKAVDTGDVRWLILRRPEAEELHLRSRIVVEEAAWPWESDEQRRAKLVLIEFMRE
jgi:4-amino-4-deoxy-L-arabinose transferase-like glycosyltransferase